MYNIIKLQQISWLAIIISRLEVFLGMDRLPVAINIAENLTNKSNGLANRGISSLMAVTRYKKKLKWIPA
jgi:hypothetical protein